MVLTLAQRLERSAKDRARYQRNRDKILARKRAYYVANRDRILAMTGAYKAASNLRRNAVLNRGPMR